MLHLTAYARTLNNSVIVVAGGPAIRALPRYSELFFDYACTGDIEQLCEVIREAFGSSYLAEEMFPRFDLAYWIDRIGEMESSRNCNFRCSFCTLTGEGGGYRKYGLDAIRRDILAVGKHRFLFFIDNNFYGNDRAFFLERIDLLRELRQKGQFRDWGALVSNWRPTFAKPPPNLKTNATQPSHLSLGHKQSSVRGRIGAGSGVGPAVLITSERGSRI
jgi:hopanoid C-2 methylase